MHLPDDLREVLVTLRAGALDPFQIAASTASPPYSVRSRLTELRRRRLVESHMRERAIMWELTPEGLRIAWEPSQMQLPGVSSR